MQHVVLFHRTLVVLRSFSSALSTPHFHADFYESELVFNDRSSSLDVNTFRLRVVELKKKTNIKRKKIFD